MNARAVLKEVAALHGRTGLDVWNVWQEFPETSHGMLVPLLVVYLIALRRRGDDPPLPAHCAAGLVLLILRALETGDPWRVVSCAIIGTSMVLL